MTVSLVQWRSVIDIFNCPSSVMSESCRCNLNSNFISAFENLLLFYHYKEIVFIFLLTFLYILDLLQCHGDIELNLGRKKLKKNSFSDFQLTQLKAYILMYKHDSK